VASLEPVYGIALAAWLLGEKPDGRTMAGGVLIIVAALIASRRTE
jgi:drug/metabolite transporter (DMT)-like permease